MIDYIIDQCLVGLCQWGNESGLGIPCQNLYKPKDRICKLCDCDSLIVCKECKKSNDYNSYLCMNHQNYVYNKITHEVYLK